jgi:hypothetical protein
VDSPKRRLLAAAKVRAALKDPSSVVIETQFVLRLPEENDHAHHVTGEVSIVVNLI